MKAVEMLQKLREEIKAVEETVTRNKTRLETLKTLLAILET